MVYTDTVVPRSGRTWLGPVQYWLVFGVALILGSVTAILPMARDHGIYAYLARAALDGRVLYRDVLTGVPPMTVVTHILADVLFGDSVSAIRILDLFLTAATAGFVLLFFVRAFGRRWLGVVAGILYPFLYHMHGFWNSAQVDGFLNLPTAASFFLVATVMTRPEHRRQALWCWVGTGGLVAVAVLYKYSVALLLPGLAFAALLARRPKRSYDWASVGLLAGGFAAVILMTVVLLCVFGALSGFVEPWLRYGLGYVSVGSGSANFLAALVTFTDRYLLHPDLGVGAVMGLVGLVVSVFLVVRSRSGSERRVRRAISLTWLWLAVAGLSVLVQGKFFLYHYLPLLPPLAVLGALGLGMLLRPLETASRVEWRRWALLVGVAFAVFACTDYPVRFKEFVRVITGRESVDHFWMRDAYSTGDFSFAEQLVVARYVKEFSDPDDRLLVWGVDPLINILSMRPSATRFPYNHVLVSEWAWDGHRAEFMSQLHRSPPELFVVAHGDETPWQTGHDMDSYAAMMAYSPLRHFAAANYDLEAQIGRFDILRRADLAEESRDDALSSPLVMADLDEAVGFISSLDDVAYHVLLWPGGREEFLRPIRPDANNGNLLTYRDLNRYFWLNEGDIDELLPALSVWVRFDSRPFTRLQPFKFQDDGEHFVVEDYRFTLLHRCENGRVLVYAIESNSRLSEI